MVLFFLSFSNSRSKFSTRDNAFIVASDTEIIGPEPNAPSQRMCRRASRLQMQLGHNRPPSFFFGEIRFHAHAGITRSGKPCQLPYGRPQSEHLAFFGRFRLGFTFAGIRSKFPRLNAGPKSLDRNTRALAGSMLALPQASQPDLRRCEAETLAGRHCQTESETVEPQSCSGSLAAYRK